MKIDRCEHVYREDDFGFPAMQVDYYHLQDSLIDQVEDQIGHGIRGILPMNKVRVFKEFMEIIMPNEINEY